MRKLISALLFALCFSGAAAAHSYKQGDIKIGHVWARATPGGVTTAAVYMPLLNDGKDADTLLGATTPVAGKTEFHEDSNANGIMKMSQLASITLEPGKPVALQPGGIHLMLFGLKQPLVKGDKFPLTLQFAKAGNAQVEVMVDDMGAKSSHD